MDVFNPTNGVTGNNPTTTGGGDKVNSVITSQFVKNSFLRPFEVGSIPTCTRPDSYNNDLELAPFTPSRYTWAVEQRKGMVCHVTDSRDPMDHIRKAMGLEFPLAKPVRLPGGNPGFA